MNQHKDIQENLKWFKKFSPLKRLKIAWEHQRAMKILRRIKIEGIRKPA
jgi:hypothetical protein